MPSTSVRTSCNRLARNLLPMEKFRSPKANSDLGCLPDTEWLSNPHHVLLQLIHQLAFANHSYASNWAVRMQEYEKKKAADPEFYRSADTMSYGKAVKDSNEAVDYMIKELEDRYICSRIGYDVRLRFCWKNHDTSGGQGLWFVDHTVEEPEVRSFVPSQGSVKPFRGERGNIPSPVSLRLISYAEYAAVCWSLLEGDEKGRGQGSELPGQGAGGQGRIADHGVAAAPRLDPAELVHRPGGMHNLYRMPFCICGDPGFIVLLSWAGNRKVMRANYSRRRRYNPDKDVDSINGMNEHFNRKIERTYGQYTQEIKVWCLPFAADSLHHALQRLSNAQRLHDMVLCGLQRVKTTSTPAYCVLQQQSQQLLATLILLASVLAGQFGARHSITGPLSVYFREKSESNCRASTVESSTADMKVVVSC